MQMFIFEYKDSFQVNNYNTNNWNRNILVLNYMYYYYIHVQFKDIVLSKLLNRVWQMKINIVCKKYKFTMLINAK